jgi:hypothetical protein
VLPLPQFHLLEPEAKPRLTGDTEPQCLASPPHLLAAAGKMTADVQMKDTEPQPAASPPAAAPAISTLQRKLPRSPPRP